MPRGDGVDRTVVRNTNLSQTQITNTQRHNERTKESYRNPDIVPERSPLNVHFKTPTGSYEEMFAEMVEQKIISTRGLKSDAKLYGELIFDVNSAYFYNHGGYEFAKKFYEAAYRAAVEIVGDEQFILSAVMHADERNKAMSEALGEDVYHYEELKEQAKDFLAAVKKAPEKVKAFLDSVLHMERPEPQRPRPRLNRDRPVSR